MAYAMVPRCRVRRGTRADLEIGEGPHSKALRLRVPRPLLIPKAKSHNVYAWLNHRVRPDAGGRGPTP